MKLFRKLAAAALAGVMALSLLPVSALAADGTIVYGGVTLYTEKRPQRYTFLRSNGENAEHEPDGTDECHAENL